MEKEKEEYDHFIGHKYREAYKSILSIVIPCVGFGIAVAWLVEMIKSPNVYWYMQLGSWIGKAVSGMVVASIMVTILFIILEKQDVDISFLKGIGMKRAKQQYAQRDFRRGEALGGMLFGSFFTALFILVPEIFCGIFKGGEEIIQVFNVSFIKATWQIILLIGAISFLAELIKFVYARYNMPVLITTILTNVAIGALNVWWLGQGQLFNDGFTEKMVSLFENQEVWLGYAFTHTNQILLAIIGFGLIVDSLEVIFKTLVPRKKQIEL